MAQDLWHLCFPLDLGRDCVRGLPVGGELLDISDDARVLVCLEDQGRVGCTRPPDGLATDDAILGIEGEVLGAERTTLVFFAVEA